MIEIAAAFAGVLLAQVSPGPNLMAVSSAALGSGRGAGIATAAGVATGVVIWAILFAFGIGALLQTFPQTITAMRFLGGGYLVYLALKALRAAFVGSGKRLVAEQLEMPLQAAYRRGLLVVMTNPKAALMWVAVSMYLAALHLSTPLFLAFGLAASASAMTIYGAYALLFSTGFAMRAYARFFRFVESAFGAVFGMIGAKLIVDGVREVRG